MDIKRENIKTEMGTIKILDRSKSSFKYLRELYSDISESEIEKTTDYEYKRIIGPLNDTIDSGEALYNIYNETYLASDQCNSHHDLCDINHSTFATCSTNINIISSSKPALFPNSEQITNKYKLDDEIYEEIDYIKVQLNKDFPNIKKDFDHFINKFQAFRTDSSQYQDLIGSRSMFFFKMIFGFAEQNYGIQNTRREAIERFVFGSATTIPNTNQIIEKCKNLYNELSSQNSSNYSIKLGSASSPYIETTFRKLINSIYSILKLREKYYKP